MTLEQFAKLAGVTVIDCDEDKWGGAFGYKERGSNSSVCGCESPDDCYRSWLERSFGEDASKALASILDENANLQHDLDLYRDALQSVVTNELPLGCPDEINPGEFVSLCVSHIDHEGYRQSVRVAAALIGMKRLYE